MQKPTNENSNIVVKEENEIYVAFDTTIDQDLELERMAREFIREIQKLRKQANVAWDQKIKLQYINDKKIELMLKKYQAEVMEKTLVSEMLSGDKFMIIV